MMAGIKPANTKPELLVRHGLHALGYRYRLHRRDLPGRPDIVFPQRRAVIFVNGCFWHGHDCHLFRWPASRVEFWRDKISGNVRRDRATRMKLAESGWRVAEVWECQLKGRERRPLDDVLGDCAAFLNGDLSHCSIGPAGTVPIEGDA